MYGSLIVCLGMAVVYNIKRSLIKIFKFSFDVVRGKGLMFAIVFLFEFIVFLSSPFCSQ